MSTRLGKMKVAVKLLGTPLTLEKGDLVVVTDATNLPGTGRVFVRPPLGEWRDGITRDVQDSILVDESEVQFPKWT